MIAKNVCLMKMLKGLNGTGGYSNASNMYFQISRTLSSLPAGNGTLLKCSSVCKRWQILILTNIR